MQFIDRQHDFNSVFNTFVRGEPVKWGQRKSGSRNYLSYGINTLTDGCFVLLQCTHLTNRQSDERSDGQTDGFTTARACPNIRVFRRALNDIFGHSGDDFSCIQAIKYTFTTS